MRVALTSDLHVEHHPHVTELVAARLAALAPLDLLIVAGDLTADDARLEATLAALRPHARHAVFIAGNHDLWVPADPARRGGADSRDRYTRVVPARARDAGFVALGGAPHQVDDFSVVGVTGWYDYSLRHQELDARFSLADYRRGRNGVMAWNDKLHIVWPGDDGALLDDEAICAEQVAALERQLAEAEALGRPIVVVTHHLPFFALTTASGRPEWDFLNGFMGSARLGAAITRTAGVRAAVAGHTHFRKSLALPCKSGPMRVEVSPVGYPREYRRAGLDLAARVAERVTVFDV